MFRLWLGSMTNGRQPVDVAMGDDGTARVTWVDGRGTADVSWDWLRDRATADNWEAQETDD